MTLGLFATLLAVIAVEATLSGTWVPRYFTVGIPVLWRRLDVASDRGPLPSAGAIEQELPHDPQDPIFVRELGGASYAFRERLSRSRRRSYMAIMRGVLRFDPARGQLSLVGHLNWSIFAGLVVTAWILARSPLPPAMSLFVLVPLVVMLAGHYFMQRRRFLEVARVVAHLWGRGSSGRDAP